jgi:hypothetical protein
VAPSKSTTIENLLAYEARHSSRHTVVIFDPHGPLARSFALHSVPAERERDAVLLEFGDTEYPIALPFFKRPAWIEKYAFTDNRYSIIRAIFPDWSETRMADICYYLVATLVLADYPSLWGFHKLIYEPAFRRRLLASGKIQDHSIHAWWARFGELSRSEQENRVAPIFARLGKLFRNKAVRNIVLQPDGPNLMELLDPGGIVLLSFGGSDIESEADTIGELLLADLLFALKARFTRDPSTLRRVFLAVDESQRYRADSLPKLLSEAGKAALTLVLASQFIANWPGAVANAVLANYGTLITFKAPSDAACLAKLLPPWTEAELSSLDRHQAVVQMNLESGDSLPAFDVRTRPVQTPDDQAMLERIRQRSRERYARPQRVVEAEIERLMAPEPSYFQEDCDEA